MKILLRIIPAGKSKKTHLSRRALSHKIISTIKMLVHTVHIELMKMGSMANWMPYLSSTSACNLPTRFLTSFSTAFPWLTITRLWLFDTSIDPSNWPLQFNLSKMLAADILTIPFDSFQHGKSSNSCSNSLYFS